MTYILINMQPGTRDHLLRQTQALVVGRQLPQPLQRDLPAEAVPYDHSRRRAPKLLHGCVSFTLVLKCCLPPHVEGTPRKDAVKYEFCHLKRPEVCTKACLFGELGHVCRGGLDGVRRLQLRAVRAGAVAALIHQQHLPGPVGWRAIIGVRVLG